jgi:hypothetical protein
MAEACARYKLSNPTPPIPAFLFENLPADRNASIWDRIERTYELSLEELSALQNARCSSQQGILLLDRKTFIFTINILVLNFFILSIYSRRQALKRRIAEFGCFGFKQFSQSPIR